MMVLVLEDDFEFILATFHWWQPSTTSLKIVPIKMFCPHSCFIDLLWKFVYSSFIWAWYFPLLRLLLRTFSGMYSYLLDVADVHQCSKVDFAYLLLCAFFMTSFHYFSIVAFSTGINIAWDVIHTSRFPEACVSERQISRVFWTTRNSRFPKFAEQNNIRTSYFFLPRFSLESILHSPVFLAYLKIFVLPRDETTCAWFQPSKRNKVKSFLEIFPSERFPTYSRYKVQNSVLSLQNQHTWNCFCLRCCGFSPILLPDWRFLLGGVSFNKTNLARLRNDSLLGT